MSRGATGDMDLFIAALARELEDGEQVHVGANQVEVALAAQLARRLWAPRLRMNVAGCWLLGLERDLSVVGCFSYEPAVVNGRTATFWQARVFDDLRRPPIVFAGGLQVDSRGNANLIGIRDGTGWRLRGPGSAGLPTLTTFAPRFYVIVPRHEERFLVEEVSEVSVVGEPAARARRGLDPGALRAVITPLARFEPIPEGLVLTELVAGVSVAEVAEHTGFEVRAAASVATRSPLSAEERVALAELRAAVSVNSGAER
ncbi:MAG: hypothetical protein ACRDLD_03660 [Thermoleophilaceae bacterium]